MSALANDVDAKVAGIDADNGEAAKLESEDTVAVAMDTSADGMSLITLSPSTSESDDCFVCTAQRRNGNFVLLPDIYCVVRLKAAVIRCKVKVLERACKLRNGNIVTNLSYICCIDAHSIVRLPPLLRASLCHYRAGQQLLVRRVIVSSDTFSVDHPCGLLHHSADASTLPHI